LSQAKGFFKAAVVLLLLSGLLYSQLPPKHIGSAVVFYSADVLALLCNICMVRAGVVGRSSPYVFVVAALTIIGSVPMLALMGYTLFFERRQEAQGE